MIKRRMIKGKNVHRTDLVDATNAPCVLLVGEDSEGYKAVLFTEAAGQDKDGNLNYDSAYVLERDEDSKGLDWYFVTAFDLTASKAHRARRIDLSTRDIKPDLLLNDSLVAAELALDKD